MWSAAIDPCVLAVNVGGDHAVDVGSFDLRVVRDAAGEHLRLARAGRSFRLDVMSGFLGEGVVGLTFLVPRDGRISAQLDTIRQFDATLARRSSGAHRASAQLSRWAMALRAYDVRASGASLRQTADLVLSPGDWPGDGECRKSSVRRMVALGEWLVAAGPRRVLAW